MQISAVFKRPFAEQVAFFRGKLGNLIPTEKWTDVWKSAHDTGFMVAGAAKAELLADFAVAVDRAISEGKSIQAFRKDFDAIVDKHGWSYRGEYNWRTRTIYRTNMATSYAAGRLAQLNDGGFTHWMYRHSDSVVSPRPLHVSWNKLALPADDPWWNSHYPPNGWGCKCYVVGVSRAAGERIGGRFEPAQDDGVEPDGRPKGIDKGWDYQPGATTVDHMRNALSAKLPDLPKPLATMLKRDLERDA
ncbi:MAG: phage minor head protein [Betaproteobacteria bacterium]|nr:phage minor head protein [Betaproteobacteria bacterium]